MSSFSIYRRFYDRSGSREGGRICVEGGDARKNKDKKGETENNEKERSACNPLTLFLGRLLSSLLPFIIFLT